MSAIARVSLVVWLLLPLLAVAADVRALVAKAEEAMQSLEYGDAVKALEAARKEPNTPRDVVLRVLELQGVAYASLGQEAKALKAFQSWLALAPDAKLSGNQPPKVTTVFFEARSFVSQKGSVTLKPSSTRGSGGVKDVRVEVANDPLKLVKEIRFFLVIDGSQRQVDVAVAGGGAVAAAGAQRVEWWALALGEKKAGLLEAGSGDKPMVEGTAPVARVEPPVKPDPKPDPKPDVKSDVKPAAKPDDAPPPPPPLVEVRESVPSRPMSTLRIAGLVAGGAGAVAVGVGSIFGVMAAGTSARVASAERDAAGRITGLTRAEALALDAQQRTQATLANVLWISGAALVGTGALLFFLGADSPVAVAPSGTGFSVFGRF
ncbi:MAG: tetratricopeptide repeat protein [Myxococcaceae bacterium]|nr:tetratricopeptide repeat protein [Myxococcaceae bacterium]